MSFGHVPDSIETRILNNLDYSLPLERNNLSEFEVYKFKHSLEAKKRNTILSPEEYASLFRCYFVLESDRKTNLFPIIEEAYSRYPQNLRIHLEATLCFQSGRDFKVFSKQGFDLRDYWFDSIRNPNRETLIASQTNRNLVVIGTKIVLKKQLSIDVKLVYPDKVILEAGPFRVETEYNQYKSNKYSGMAFVVNDFIRALRIDDVDEEKTLYLGSYLNKNSMDFLFDFGNYKLNPIAEKKADEALHEIESGESINLS